MWWNDLPNNVSQMFDLDTGGWHYTIVSGSLTKLVSDKGVVCDMWDGMTVYPEHRFKTYDYWLNEREEGDASALNNSKVLIQGEPKALFINMMATFIDSLRSDVWLRNYNRVVFRSTPAAYVPPHRAWMGFYARLAMYRE